MDSQRIAWRRLFAEGAAIVVSILLAFAIDAAWDRNQELYEEREILVSLESEFADLSTQLGTWERFDRWWSRRAAEFLSDSVTSMTHAGADSVLSFATVSNVIDQGGALDALIASGRLELVRDRELRWQLAKMTDYIDDLRVNSLSARNYIDTSIRPYLIEQGIPEQLCEGPDTFLCTEPGPIPASHVRISRDPTLRAMLILRRNATRQSALDHRKALDAAESILTAIREKLAR